MQAGQVLCLTSLPNFRAHTHVVLFHFRTTSDRYYNSRSYSEAAANVTQLSHAAKPHFNFNENPLLCARFRVLSSFLLYVSHTQWFDSGMITQLWPFILKISLHLGF